MKKGSFIIRVAFALFLSIGNTARSDAFRILNSEQDALQARVDLIQQAKRRIDVIYFGIDGGTISMAGLALLRQASQRGIKVRVITDFLYNKIPGSIIAALVEDGVAIKEYHPFRITKLHWLVRRLHDKVLIGDGRDLVTGGRNVADNYFGLAENNYVDRDAITRGEAALEAFRYFEALWASAHVANVDLGISDGAVLLDNCRKLRTGGLKESCFRTAGAAQKGVESARAELIDQIDEIKKAGTVTLDSQNDWTQEASNVQGVRFIHDVPGEKTKLPGINEAVLDLVDHARRSIFIESLCFIPNKDMESALRRALDRGVKITVLTNSLESRDSDLPQAAYEVRKRSYLEWGIQIWEYAGPGRVHAKGALIDDRVVMIGSYNIDNRSARLNTEVGVVVDNPEIAQKFRLSLEEHLQSSKFGEVRDFHGVGRLRALWLGFLGKVVAPLLTNQL